MKYQPSDEFHVMLGVFNQPDDIFDRDDQGVNWRIGGDDGVSIFTQVGWNPEFAERPAHFFVGMNNALFYDIDNALVLGVQFGASF